MKEIIKSNNIVLEDEIIKGYITFEDGKITEITTEERKETKDVKDNYVIPGIIDTHNHQSGGYGFYGPDEEYRRDNMIHYLKFLASLGVTGVFPTLFSTKADQRSIDVLKTCKEFIGKKVDGTKALATNFEGPFLDRTGEGAASYEPDPIDLKAIQEYIDVTDGTMKVIGLAPELPNSTEAIKMLNSAGIFPSMAHTNAKSEGAYKAFDDGITVATHTCNVMVGIHHRNIGSLGAALMDDRVTCELICDSLHVCNDMLKLIMKLKPHDKIMMISDSSDLVGFPSGTYDIDGDITVLDEEGRVICGGALSGSSKGVIWGIRNLVKNCGLDLVDVMHMAALVPAKKYGFDSKGSLKVGKDADLVIIDEDFNVLETYVEGTCVFDSSKEKPGLNPKILASKIK